jgi:hypothetical protein
VTVRAQLSKPQQEPTAGAKIACLSALIVLGVTATSRADLVPTSRPFGVESPGDYSASYPDVAALSDGAFIIVWQNYLPTVLTGRRFDALGRPFGTEFQFDDSRSSSGPALAASVDGRFMVVWADVRPGGVGFEIIGRRFSSDANPLEPELSVSEGVAATDHAALALSVARIAPAADGGIMVAWTEESYGLPGSESGARIIGRRYDASGMAQRALQLNQKPDNTFCCASLVEKKDGFLVTWPKLRSDGTTRIVGRLLSSSGRPAGPPFRANSTGAISNRQRPTIAVASRTGDDGFIVTWQTTHHLRSGVDDSGMFARRFADDGTPRGQDFRVSGAVADYDVDTQVAPLPDGGFIATWHRLDSIHARRFRASGEAAGPSFKLVEGPLLGSLALAAGPVNALVATWTAYDHLGGPGDIFAQRFCVDVPALERCGDATNGSGGASDDTSATRLVTAADALIVLKAANGAASCAACVCDTDASGDVTATDALLTLKRALDESFHLGCIACPIDAQALCEQTFGQWDDRSCGDYRCGRRPVCQALIPGCNCGPGRIFDAACGCGSSPVCLP